MAQVISSEIIDGLILRPEMFRKTEQDFPAFVDDVISEQAELLEGRIGSTAYASTDKPLATYTKRAEKCMVAAELLKRRRNKIIADAKANGEEIKTVSLDTQIRDYSTEAELWIGKASAGVTVDDNAFGSDVLISGEDRLSNFGRPS